MRFATVFFLLLASPVFAAPPPKEPESVKLKRLWGEMIDSDKDCTFTLDGDKLKISVPGKSHLFRAAMHGGGRGQEDNAPRTAKTVTGDFTVEVQFVQSIPAADAANAGALTSIGVYVLGGSSACAISRQHTSDAGGQVKAGNFRLQGRKTNSSTSGSRGASGDEATKPVTVRLVREGSKIQSKYSTDGKTWKSLWAGYEGEFPAEVTVGVFAENTGTKGLDAVFDGFKIDTGEKK